MKPTFEERVRSKIDTSAGPDACHPWTGGYGQFGTPSIFVSRNGRKGSASARKVVWELAHGEVPAEHLVMVTCENRSCVNIKHLKLESRRAEDMFWNQVQKTDGCWLWTGYIRKAGYGAFMYAGVYQAAHRFSYELHYGKIEGHVGHDKDREICVCHHCDNPTCVRPDHLFLGKDKDNHDDMVRKGRHAHGPKLKAAMARSREQRLASGAGPRHGDGEERSNG